MTNQQYVIRAAQTLGLDLLRPTRGAPEVLAYDWSTGKGKCVVEAKNWAEAREQINAYARQRAAC